MIKHLSSKQINPEKWNACIQRIDKSFFYGLFQYLDTICQWNALVNEDSQGSYLFVIPLPYKKKWGVKYLYQPFFCQQLGVFGQENLSEIEANQVIKLIKRHYSHGDLAWHNKPTFKQVNYKQQPNYLLDLNTNYDVIFNGYNSNRKRVIKKCKKSTTSISCSHKMSDVAKAVFSFQRVLGHLFPEVKTEHFNHLLSALDSIKTIIDIELCQINFQDSVIASALFITYNNRVVYLLGYVEDEFRKSGLNALLFDKMIFKYAGQEKILDFEGSKNKGISQFYASFGAKNHPYYTFQLSSIINEILKIVR